MDVVRRELMPRTTMKVTASPPTMEISRTRVMRNWTVFSVEKTLAASASLSRRVRSRSASAMARRSSSAWWPAVKRAKASEFSALRLLSRNLIPEAVEAVEGGPEALEQLALLVAGEVGFEGFAVGVDGGFGLDDVALEGGHAGWIGGADVLEHVAAHLEQGGFDGAGVGDAGDTILGKAGYAGIDAAEADERDGSESGGQGDQRH